MRESRTHDRTTVVDWTREADGPVADPLVRPVPYVEVKLEHPGLDATSVGRSFFPDAVPYELDGDHRVFYWRSALPSQSPPPASWTGVCATTDSLEAIIHEEASEPALVGGSDRGQELVVDGTVAGDSTTAVVEAYDSPTVELRHVTPDGVELRIAGRTELVQPGARERFELPARECRLVEPGEVVSTTPELVVRFPGRRVLYHPAPGAGYQLFPSFGLDVEDLPRPITVPTRDGELDHRALAERVGVSPSERPYPERVLWQAFAYTAFDPHRTTLPTLTQFESGEIAVW